MFKKTGMILTTALVGISLTGCFEDDASDSTSTVAAVPSKVEDISLYAQDTRLITTPDTKAYSVDLSKRVTSNSEYKLVDVSNLSTDSRCDVLAVEDKQFTLDASVAKVCSYQYTVEPSDSRQVVEKATGLVQVAITADTQDVELPELAVTNLAKEASEIDLKALLAAEGVDTKELIVNTDVALLDGSTSVARVNSDTQTLNYQPQDDFEGVDRVLYSLSDKQGVNMKMGSLAIANRLAERDTSGDIDIEPNPYVGEAKVGELTWFDIRPYIKLAYNEGFAIQAIQSYNSLVIPGGDRFAIMPNESGMYTVSMIIEGMTSGDIYIFVARVAGVDDGPRWPDINVALDLYSAPKTVVEATTNGIDYDSTILDDQDEVAGYSSYDSAAAYCNVRGRLPTSEEFRNDLAPYIVQFNNKEDWPESREYIVSDVAGSYYVVDLRTGILKEPQAGKAYIVSCILNGGLSVQVTDGEAVANGVDTAKVEFSLSKAGKPLSNVNVSPVISGNASFVNSTVATDANGKAAFELTSIIAGTDEVSYDMEGESVSARVDFIADVNSASISLEIIKDGAEAATGETNVVRAKVFDAYNNPLKNLYFNVSLNEENADSSARVKTPLIATGDDGQLDFEIVNSEGEYVEVTAALYDQTTGNDSDTVTVTFEKDPLVIGGGKLHPPVTIQQGRDWNVTTDSGNYFHDDFPHIGGGWLGFPYYRGLEACRKKYGPNTRFPTYEEMEEFRIQNAGKVDFLYDLEFPTTYPSVMNIGTKYGNDDLTAYALDYQPWMLLAQNPASAGQRTKSGTYQPGYRFTDERGFQPGTTKFSNTQSFWDAAFYKTAGAFLLVCMEPNP